MSAISINNFRTELANSKEAKALNMEADSIQFTMFETKDKDGNITEWVSTLSKELRVKIVMLESTYNKFASKKKSKLNRDSVLGRKIKHLKFKTGDLKGKAYTSHIFYDLADVEGAKGTLFSLLENTDFNFQD